MRTPASGKVDTGPPAQGERRSWSDLPLEVRRHLEDHLKAKVVRAISEVGGFSPGVASRLRLSDGRRVFTKVVGPRPNPDSPRLHRSEARILAQLPPTAPVPRLLSLYDDGEWVALFLQEVDGQTPHLPWEGSELRRVLQAIDGLSKGLTPAPFPAPTFGERHREIFTGWRGIGDWLRSRGDEPTGADRWIIDHWTTLARLEGRFPVASSGETLLHSDLRADNILVTSDRVYFADWPGACIGAPWVDLVCFLPSVAMQGGPPPWTLFDNHPLAHEATEDDVTSVLAALAGYFVANARKPPPPGLSTLRPFQRAQGVEALAWLRRRLGED